MTEFLQAVFVYDGAEDFLVKSECGETMLEFFLRNSQKYYL